VRQTKLKRTPRPRLGQPVARGDLNRSLHRARHGAAAGVESVDPLDHGRVNFVASAQCVVGVDPLDDEDLALELDLAPNFGGQLATGRIYLARLQRAPEGPGQSAAGRCDNVVEGRCVRGKVLGVDAVVIGDLRMDTEGDHSLRARKLRLAQRTALARDRHP
jgi:hypothetical protein